MNASMALFVLATLHQGVRCLLTLLDTYVVVGAMAYLRCSPSSFKTFRIPLTFIKLPLDTDGPRGRKLHNSAIGFGLMLGRSLWLKTAVCPWECMQCLTER